MSGRLIHTGQVLIDLVMQIEQLPTPGSDVIASGARFEVGGGFNVMAAARRDGMAVVYTGGHGRGRFGDMARDAMVREGIDCLAAIDESRDTGFCIALTEHSSERTFITHSGAEIESASTTFSHVAVRPEDVIYLSGYSLDNAAKGDQLVRWLRQLPTKQLIVFDPGPRVDKIDPNLLKQILSLTTILSCNGLEALALTGESPRSRASDALAQCLPADSLMIVRDGTHGCYLHNHGKRHHVVGFDVDAVDTNGAGDAHTGVLIAAMSSGASPIVAATRANAAAALAVARLGPATAPTATEIDAFIADAGRTTPC